eukprot:TRINITY_DN7070_c0_g1_i2.p1 TRINITY_DN7070_c0_g1~~TRINITY_DN7070_c0_g1_i2.p1  ORF type:complete len:121 (-),score=39.47 TRINITY_DN7070_c0_g1_i2:397-759(-)
MVVTPIIFLLMSPERFQQQHMLLKVIQELVWKLDMIKKISDDKYGAFWAEHSTIIKLGVSEDTANRTRLAKLFTFTSSKALALARGKLSLAEHGRRVQGGGYKVSICRDSSRRDRGSVSH